MPDDSALIPVNATLLKYSLDNQTEGVAHPAHSFSAVLGVLCG